MKDEETCVIVSRLWGLGVPTEVIIDFMVGRVLRESGVANDLYDALKKQFATIEKRVSPSAN